MAMIINSILPASSSEYIPFWIQPVQNTTVKFVMNGSYTLNKTLKYSTDAQNWTSITLSDFISTGVSVNALQKLYIASDDNLAFAESWSNFVKLDVDTGYFLVGGEIKSLFNKSDTLPQKALYEFFYQNTKIRSAEDLIFPKSSNNCCDSMFRQCTSLIYPPKKLNEVVAERSYYCMFYNCTSLTKAPVLPAVSLASGCYDSMFYQTAITSCPNLPATTLAASCYYGMFSGCTSLTSAPAILPATTLQTQCYYQMFYGCTNLSAAPKIAATSIASSVSQVCYSMFQNCSSLSTIPLIRFTNIPMNGCNSMFNGCTALKFSTTQTSECSNAYRIPNTGTGTAGTNAFTNMFKNTSGTYKSNPTINTTYYTNATLV